MKFSAYWRLMRFHKPVGTLLLWFPTAWALWIAQRGQPSWSLLFLFFCGTVIMRAAGCVLNDLADKEFDQQVTRTKLRPLAAGELKTKEALILLCFLLFIALLILLQLPAACFLWGMVALTVATLYPFCKRFLAAPQLILGLAFSMGIPMAFVASNKPLDDTCVLLFLLNFSWIVLYDTLYAMIDKEDDLKIGVRSTAIYFAQHTHLIISLLQLVMQTLWLYLAWMLQVSASFYVLWILSWGILIWQQKLLMQAKPELCFKGFEISVYYGAIMWIALILGFAIH